MSTRRPGIGLGTRLGGRLHGLFGNLRGGQHGDRWARTDWVRTDWSRFAPLVALAILFVISAVASPYFLKAQNLLNILRQVSYTGTIALGMTFVIIGGGIDLSVGSLAAMAGGLAILAINATGGGTGGIALGIATALAVGMAGGMPVMVCGGTPFSGYSASTSTNQGIIMVIPATAGMANRPRAAARAHLTPS